MSLSKRLISTDAAGGADGSANFAPVLYTGNSGTNAISSLNFSPDFVWIKCRTDVRSHSLLDTVRGAPKIIQSESVAVEWDGSLYFDSFDSNGFTVKSSANFINNSSHNYVAWCWKAGGSAVSNTDGAITSTVSANVDAGFSIATWSGNGSASNIGHGLGGTPQLMIIKNRAGTNSWIIGVPDVFGVGYMTFDNGIKSGSNVFGQVPDSTKYYFNTAAGGNGHLGTGNYVGYFFRNIAGYQKIGSYTGNGTSLSDNQDITTGFRPRFVLIKNYGAGSTNWVIVDSEREDGDKWLFANTLDAEYDDGNTYVTFKNTAFNVATQGASVNANTNTYIYLAIA